MFLLAKYGVQTTFYFPMVKRGVVDLAATADWTPATGDTKISKDGGNFANTTNNPAAVGGTGSVGWSLTITATELQAAVINIQIVDAANKAVEDQFITIYTYGNASAKIVPDWSDTVRMGLTALPNAAAEASGGLYTRGTGAGQIAQDASGNVRVNVDTIKTQAVTLSGGVTIPAATLASTTNITAASGITVSTNGDKTGYSLSQAFPANFSSLSIAASTGLVDITQTAADKVWGTSSRVLTANTNLNDPTAAAIADAVWDETSTGHVDAGKAGTQIWTDIDAILVDTTEIGIAGAGLTGVAVGVGGIAATSFAVGAIDAASLAADVTTELTAGFKVKKNAALANFMFLMVNSTDHVTPKIGLTITATRSIDGAAFAACANSATEVANGMYKINLAATDLNGDVIAFKFTGGATADDRLLTVVTTT